MSAGGARLRRERFKVSIEANQIALNRYAPAGSQAINLYATETASGLTIGQLVAVVCIRTAGALEEQSVNKMNMMSVGNLLHVG